MVLWANWHFSQNLHFCLHFSCDFKGLKIGQEVKYIMSIVNLNMVYQIPIWKLEKFYLGAHRSKKHVLFGPKCIKCYLWWDTPHLHTKPNLLQCRKVQRSEIIKQNWIISICSSFIAFLAELFRGMLFKWKGENKKSHQKWDLIVNLRPWLAK